MYNIPFTGNLTHDLELKTDTTSGKPRLHFSIGVNEGERGTDSERKHFFPFTAYGEVAENAVKSLKKGDRITVLARIGTYKKAVTTNGEDKEITMLGLTAKSIGPDLTWATATVSKNPRKDGDSAAPAKKAPAPKAKAPAPADDDDDDF